MEYGSTELLSAESISFRLLPESPQPNFPGNHKDSHQLEYSVSYILTPNQSPQIPITIAIQHYTKHPINLNVPKPAIISATNNHQDIHSKMQHCLGQGRNNLKYTQKYQQSTMPDQNASKSTSKAHLPGISARRCCSLPHASPRVPELMPRKRSKTMLSIGLKCQLKENSKYWQTVRGKQNKKVWLPIKKCKEKQLISNNVYRKWKEVKFEEGLEMSFVAKKLTLCENVIQYKKYLKKITGNRQTEQHPSPDFQRLPPI